MTDANANSLTLIHFGDLHLWSLGWDRDPAFKRLLGLANLILRRGRKFPFPLAHALIDQLGREEADALLFTGDLTTTALRREFNAGRQLFLPLTQRWDGRFFALPGNHDRYTPQAVRTRLFETMFHTLPAEPPFAVDLNDHWTLVVFDCAVARRVSSRGLLTERQLARLDELLTEGQRRGRRLLVAGHYPLVYPPGHQPGWEHVLPQREAARAILRAHGVQVYLHGHVHNRWRLEDGGLTHLNCGSAGMNGSVPARRPGYLKLRLGPDGLDSVQAHWLRGFAHQQRHAAPQDWSREELASQTL